MAIAIPIVMLAAAAVSAYGQYQQGQASEATAGYNAKVASQNANIAQQNAIISSQAGSSLAGMQSQKTRATIGSIRADQGASGVQTDTGSAAQTKISARELGEIDALTVRSNALKEAHGYQVQSENQMAQSLLDKYEGAAASSAGKFGAGSTFLGGVAKAAGSYYQGKQAGMYA